MVFWGYTGKYELGNNTLLAQYSGPFNPQEKFSAGVVGRPSRRMHLFAEAKINPQDQTDVLLGTRLRFNAGNITGSVSTSGKATSVFKFYHETGMEIGLTTTMDFAKPKQPITFGLGLNLGGG